MRKDTIICIRREDYTTDVFDSFDNHLQFSKNHCSIECALPIP